MRIVGKSVAALIAAGYFLATCDGARLLRHSGSNSSNSSGASEASVAPVASLAAANSSKVKTRAPRVYFLFMAVDKVSNLGVWWSFFRNAPADQYRAYIHCKEESCKTFVAGSPLVPVVTVNSYYCTDLVSPMNQLINVALQDDPTMSNPLDKFALISDSSLPAKPFSQVYLTLTTRQGSDFCIFPSVEWADIPSGRGGLEMAVKHHQWITLTREHAQKAWNLWSTGTLHNFMTYFGMNSQQYSWNNNSFADNRNWGCLDEFWHMTALYGTIQQVDPTKDRQVTLPSFSRAPLWVSRTAGWQGECDTFVIWAKYLNTPGHNPFKDLHSSLDADSIPHGGNSARPGWWDKISTTGIQVIRNSAFLFVRKFIDAPHLTDGGDFAEAYSRLVFAQ